MLPNIKGSSQIYNTSARHEQHECDTNATQVQHECNNRATRVRYEQHECDTSATRVLQERHECDTSATRVKSFDFNNDTSKTIFSHPYIYYYMASEELQGEEQFHSKNYFLEMPFFHAKMRLKSAPQKLNFLMTKAISKSCTRDCSCKSPCTFPYSYAW